MNVNELLLFANISPEELADIINQAGGRASYKPIIYPVTCQNTSCKNLFFCTVQDYRMRDNHKYSHLCPGCREEDRRIKKQKYNSKRKG